MKHTTLNQIALNQHSRALRAHTTTLDRTLSAQEVEVQLRKLTLDIAMYRYQPRTLSILDHLWRAAPTQRPAHTQSQPRQRATALDITLRAMTPSHHACPTGCPDQCSQCHAAEQALDSLLACSMYCICPKLYTRTQQLCNPRYVQRPAHITPAQHSQRCGCPAAACSGRSSLPPQH